MLGKKSIKYRSHTTGTLSGATSTFFYYHDNKTGCFRNMLIDITSTKAGKKLDHINLGSPLQYDISAFMSIYQEARKLIAQEKSNFASTSSSPKPAFLLTDQDTNQEIDLVPQMPPPTFPCPNHRPKVSERKKLAPSIDENKLTNAIAKAVTTPLYPALNSSNEPDTNKANKFQRRKSFHFTQEELNTSSLNY